MSESILHDLEKPKLFELPSNGKKIKLKRYYEYEFEDTGVVIFYRKINSSIIRDAERALVSDKPKPPIEELELAGQPTQYENKDDPNYMRSLADWQSQVNELAERMALSRAIIGIADNGWNDDVLGYREEMAEFGAIDLEPSNVILYIERIASGSNEGYQEFIQEITRRTRVTPDEVSSQIESFRASGDPRSNGAAIQQEAAIKVPNRQERIRV